MHLASRHVSSINKYRASCWDLISLTRGNSCITAQDMLSHSIGTEHPLRSDLTDMRELKHLASRHVSSFNRYIASCWDLIWETRGNSCISPQDMLAHSISTERPAVIWSDKHGNSCILPQEILAHSIGRERPSEIWPDRHAGIHAPRLRTC